MARPGPAARGPARGRNLYLQPVTTRSLSILLSYATYGLVLGLWLMLGLVRGRGGRVASFFFGVRIMLGTILGRFSIIYFRGLGLRIRVRVWVSHLVLWLGLGLVWCYGQGKFRVRVRVRVGFGLGL